MKKITIAYTCIVDESKLAPEIVAAIERGPTSEELHSMFDFGSDGPDLVSHEASYKCEDIPAEDQPSTP